MRGRDGLLTSVRVLDLGGPESDGVGRILADLGADVVKVVTPDDDNDGYLSGIAFAMANANKRCVVVDPADTHRCEHIAGLAGAADIVVDSGRPGRALAFGPSCPQLVDLHPHLVGLQVTDFGGEGPRADWNATDAVLYAMSTSLSRSGPTAGRPVLPPRGIASGTAAAQAAWAVLVAYFNRLRCGRGDFVDFSRYEGVLQALDPPFGTEGQAAVGQRTPAELWRGRPRNQQLYPIFDCADGSVRICLLSARQWRGMRDWLGEPAHLQDPQLDTIGGRYAAAVEINAAIGELCRDLTMADLVTAGQKRGVPIAAVLAPAAALDTDHARAVGALARVAVEPGTEVTVPAGPFVVDGAHRPFHPPTVVEHVEWSARQTAPASWATDGRPFDGLRVIDLGVIVAGGELGRLFADMGAEVIKVESADYPDGLRQTPPGMPMSRSWALAHRNEQSIGLNLRHAEGAALFRSLVSRADVVLANFKPGVLAALGFSHDELRQINPGIVLAESSAFGATGPWSDRMGYGPLVRASTGITRLWTSPDPDDDSSYDATTIFPDHIAARLAGIAALAALIGRAETGNGAWVHVSQAEAAVNQLAVTYTADAARAAGVRVDETAAGWDLVCPCRGEDEWCVISVRDQHDRTALAQLMARDHLPGERAALADTVSAWTTDQDKDELAELLQRNGIPAAPMQRAVDVLSDPQVVARRFYADLRHPLFADPLPSESTPARYRHIPPAELRPAPTAGEHTRDLCRTVLRLPDAETERLIADGALFAPPAPSSPDGLER